MRKDDKIQILDHSIEKFNLIVRDDTDMFLFTKILIQVNKNDVLQVDSMSSAKKIAEELNWYIERNEQVRL